MRYHFTPVSRNAKTGPIPVVTASAETCPDSCSLRGAGCYAEHGPLAIHWRRTEAWGLDLDALCQRIRRLPRRQLWRYGQAGDLPGMGDRIDAAALSQLARANGGRPVLAYTHKPATPENLKALHRAAAAGFLVNLSADHPLHADDLAETGLPVVTVLPSAFARRKTETLSSFRVRLRHQPKHTPAGRRIAICPATYTDTTCASCQACASRPWRRHHRLPRARHESSIDRPAHSEIRQAAAQTGHLRSRQVPPEVMVQRQPGNSSFIYWISNDFSLNGMIPINISRSDKNNWSPMQMARTGLLHLCIGLQIEQHREIKWDVAHPPSDRQISPVP